MPPMRKIWNAANVSLRWYERMDELVATRSPVEFAYDPQGGRREMKKPISSMKTSCVPSNLECPRPLEKESGSIG